MQHPSPLVNIKQFIVTQSSHHHRHGQQYFLMGNDTGSATWGQTHKGGGTWRQTVLMLIAACVEG